MPSISNDGSDPLNIPDRTPVHRFTVKQTFRVEREVIIYVRAENRDSAREKIEAGEIELPTYTDSGWREIHRDLMNEEIVE